MVEQTKLKPKIEDIASGYIDGDNLSNLLDFVAWMRANRITPTYGSTSAIGIRYTSRIFHLKLFHGEWFLWVSGKSGALYEHDLLNCDELKEVVWDSLAPCIDCGHNCNSGMGLSLNVCGKEFEKLCGCCTIRFRNPSAQTLSTIRKVVEARLSAAKTSRR